MTGAMLLVAGAAAAVHIASAIVILRSRERSASRRALALALVGTVPIAGIPLGFVTLAARGGGGSPAFEQPDLEPEACARIAVPRDDRSVVDRLSGSRNDRRAAVATLAHRGNADAVATLRWVIERGDPDAVVDAALALQEVEDRHAARVSSDQAEADKQQTWRHAMAAADRVAEAIHTELADPSAVPRVCAAARTLYETAAERAAPEVPAVLAERWAALELAAMRPEAALEILDRGAPVTHADAPRLAALRSDVEFAARRSSVGQT